MDHDGYYHARVHDKDTAPYTVLHMNKAPEQYVNYGRFNNIEKSYYYFADTVDGAVKEIKIHDDSLTKDIQVAEIEGRQGIRLID